LGFAASQNNKYTLTNLDIATHMRELKILNNENPQTKKQSGARKNASRLHYVKSQAQRFNE
jgi:hypothetical protein